MNSFPLIKKDNMIFPPLNRENDKVEIEEKDM